MPESSSITKTPPKRMNSLTQSTPSNRGTSSNTSYYPELTLNHLTRGNLEDVRNASECNITALLAVFLQRCLRTGQPPPRFLEDCLELVKPAFEATKDLLPAYCRAAPESVRYGPLVSLCNAALSELQKVEHPDLRPPSDFHIIFDVCATQEFHGHYKSASGSLKTTRKPDIVCLDYKIANKVHGLSGDDWTATRIAIDAAAKASSRPHPQYRMVWSDLLCTAGIKCHRVVLDTPSPFGAGLQHVKQQHLHAQPPNGSTFQTSLNVVEELDGHQRPIEASAPQHAIPDDLTQNQVPSSSGLSAGHVTQLRTSSMSEAQTPASEDTTASRSVRSGEKRSAASDSAPTTRPPESKRRKIGAEREVKSDGGHIKSDRMESVGSGGKRKVVSNKITGRPPGMVQAANHAADMLSRDCNLSHTIQLVVEDQKVFVWWYDRQGPIQSSGINLALNLPYFLLLLLTLQRFNREDWGIIPALSNTCTNLQVNTHTRLAANEGADAPINDVIDPKRIDVCINLSQVVHSHLGLAGRHTRVVAASSTAPHPRDPAESLAKLALVAKIYWPEDSRTPEDLIIENAYARGSGDKYILEHLPDLIGWLDIGYSTRSIRIELGLKPDGWRLCRIIIFRKLFPITNLPPDLFFEAFHQCVRCHYKLWSLGIQHRDVSELNLMYDEKDTSFRGRLNDYDLARINDLDHSPGVERTGTLPFMALDLLTEQGYRGQIKRLYRHDLESFVWVFIWIICRYTGGKLVDNAPFDDWATGTHTQCRAAKSSLRQDQVEQLIQTEYRFYITPATELLQNVLNRDMEHHRAGSITAQPDRPVTEMFNGIAVNPNVVKTLRKRHIQPVMVVPVTEPDGSTLVGEFQLALGLEREEW